MRKKQIFLLLSAILILTAIMTACSAEIYNVDFYVDGVLYKSYKVEVNQSLDDVPEVPLKDGYIGKWDVVDFDEITESIKVNAIYTANTYTITFIADGTVVSEQKASKGKTISTIPSVPKKDGYTGEWNVSNFTDINTDMTVTAIYTPIAQYAYFYDNEYVFTPAIVRVGDKVELDTYYVLVDGEYRLTQDNKFLKDVTYFTRSRELIAKILILDGEVNSIPTPPKKDGISTRWMQEITSDNGVTYVNPSYTNVNGDLTIVAYDFVTVTLKDTFTGEETIKYLYYDINQTITNVASILQDVDQTENEFYGWFYDKECKQEVDFPCEFNVDVTLYAKWVSIKSTDGLTYIDNAVSGYVGTETEIYVPYKYVDANGNENKITRVNGNVFAGNTSITKVYLPNTLTEIADEAFDGCTSLQSVIFNDGSYVQKIGNKAFNGCTNLTSFILSNTTISIGNNAFANCEKMTSIEGLENSSILIIEESVFENCSSLESIYLPSTVVEIKENAFRNAQKASISFVNSDNLQKIGSYAFYNCHNFKGFTVKNLISLGEEVFAGCYSITEITLVAGKALGELFATNIDDEYANQFYSVTVGEQNRYVPKMLFNVTVTAGDGVLTENAFADCYSVKKVTLRDGITTIEKNAFNISNYQLTNDVLSITFPSTLLSIGESAFETRNDLTEVRFPSSLTTLEKKAFYGITSLSTVYVPNNNSIVNVGERVFSGTNWFNDYVGLIKVGQVVVGISDNYCRKNGVTEIKATDMVGVKKIAPYAFYGDSYIKSITLGSGIYEIGDYAFAESSALKTIVFNSNKQNAMVRIIGTTILNNVNTIESITLYEDILLSNLFTNSPTALKILTINNDGNTTTINKELYSGYSSIEELYVGDNYTNVEESAFVGLDNLKKVSMGKDVVNIGNKAFYGNGALSIVDFTANEVLKIIENYAFANTALEELNLPNSVETIEEYAFANTALKEFIAPSMLKTISKGAFSNSPISTVKLNENLAEIGEQGFYNCDIRDFTLPELTEVKFGALLSNDNLSSLTISHGFKISVMFTEIVDEQENITIPINFNTIIVKNGEIIEKQFEYIDNLQIVTINKGVSKIGDYAFEGSGKLTRVTIPNTVTEIGVGAFKDCVNLSVCQIDSSDSELVAIGNSVFSGCSSLTYAMLPNTISNDVSEDRKEEYTWTEVFKNCTQLTSTNLPTNVTNIGKEAYYGCANVVSIEMGDQVTDIGDFAFYGCAKIDFDDVNFEKLVTIGESAFDGCKNLHGIRAPKSTTIGENAYANCNSVAEITVIDKSLDFYASNDKSNVTTINIIGAISGENYFSGCDNLECITYYGNEKSVAESIPTLCNNESISPMIFVKKAVYDEVSTEIKPFLHCYPANVTFSYIFNDEDKTATISALTNTLTDGVVYLPNEVEKDGVTYTVTAIGSLLFESNAIVDTVVVPVSIKEINLQAFSKSSLKKIIFESGSRLESIGASVFSECGNLESIKIPSSVKTIGNNAFYGCTNLDTVNIYANSKLKSIGSYAFYNTTSLTSFSIKSEVETIGEHAFELSGLTNFDFGTKIKLTKIEEAVFANTKLTSITIPNEVVSIGNYAFSVFCGTEIAIPDKVVSIGNYAFNNALNLTTLSIGSSVQVIGDSAFEGCQSLESVILPNSITTIGNSAFKNCIKISTLTISKNVISIGTNAFYSTSNLSQINFNAIALNNLEANNGVFYQSGKNTNGITVTIDGYVTLIPEYMFNPNNTQDGAPKITNVVTGDFSRCEQIGKYAFAYCSGISKFIVSVLTDYVGENAFYGCTSAQIKMENVNVPIRFDSKWLGNVTNVVYGYNNLSENEYSYVLHENKAFITQYNGEETEISIPNSLGGYEVASVGTAFVNNVNLTTMELPSTITYTGSFYGCSALSEITINASVDKIQNYAFYNCSSLAFIEIGETVSQIGENAFYGCTGLKTVYIESVTIAETAIESVDKTGDLFANADIVYVLDTAVSTEEINEELKLLTDVVDGYNVYTKLYWEVGKTKQDKVFVYLLTEDVKNGTFNLYLDGYGNMKDYSGTNDTEWYGYKDNVISVTLGENVTSFGKYSFSEFTKLEIINLLSINATDGNGNLWLFSGSGTDGNGIILCVGENVVSIPAYAFYNCDRITGIETSGNALSNIGGYAFANCDGLTEIVIPDSVLTIGENAFSLCNNVKSITLGKNVKTISSKAFYNIKELRTINFNAINMNDLEGDINLFTNEYSLIEGDLGLTLVIGRETMHIPAYLMYKCNYLTNVSYDAYTAIKTIGNHAFSACSGLVSISLPNTITEIKESVFEGSANLNSISFGQNSQLKNIGANAFYNTAYYSEDDNWTDNVLYLNTYLINANVSVVDEYTIVSGTTIVAENAFIDCDVLRFVNVPQTVVDINKNAFNGCINLNTVYISSKEVAIGLREKGSQGGLVDNALHVYISENLITENKIQVGNYVANGYSVVETDAEVNKVKYYVYTTERWDVSNENDDKVYAYIINDTLIKGSYVLKVNGTGYMINYDGVGQSDWNEYLSKISRIIVGESVKSIGDYAFANCENVIEISYQGTSLLESIGASSFSNCQSLTEITVPDNVVEIKSRAFYRCVSVTSIKYSAVMCQDLSNGNNVFTDVGINENGVEVRVANYVKYIPANLFNATESAEGRPNVAWLRFESIGNVNLCTTIGEYAFYWCSGLYSITFASGANLSKIGDYAFANCEQLESLALTAGINEVGKGAFYNCANLQEVVFNAVSYKEGIEDNAPFEGAGKNNGYKLTVSVKSESIPSYLFEKSEYLTEIEFLTDCIITSIGEKAFEDCIGLRNVALPNCIEEIAIGAFSGCTSLESYVAPFIGGRAGEMSATQYSLFGYVFGEDEKENTTLTMQSYGSAASYRFYVPNSLIYVNITLYSNVYYGAFQNCNNIVRVVINSNTGLQTIDKHEYDSAGEIISTTSIVNGSVIGINAFKNCNSLDSVTLPEPLLTIGESAFDGCTMLKSITIPEFVENIGEKAFANTSWLTQVNFNATNCDNARQDSEWFDNAGINQGGIKVTYAKNVVKVPANMFYSTNSANLTKIEFEENSTCLEIGENAFRNTFDLVEVAIPSSVVKIGKEAFGDSGYYNDTKNWLSGVLYIDECLIKANTSLISGSYNAILRTRVVADYAFYSCDKLTAITLPVATTHIGAYAFANCGVLKQFNLDTASNLKYIGERAFSGCVVLGTEKDAEDKILGIKITSKVETIGDSCFEQCVGLTLIYIDSSTVALGLSSNTSNVFGFICGYADTIYMHEDIVVVGGYVTGSYYEDGTDGEYVVYRKRII